MPYVSIRKRLRAGNTVEVINRWSERFSIPILVSHFKYQALLVSHIRYFERQFPTVAGNIDKLRQLAKQTSRKWIKGMGCAFSPVPG